MRHGAPVLHLVEDPATRRVTRHIQRVGEIMPLGDAAGQVGQQALLDLLEPHTLYYTHNAHNVKFEIEKNTEPRIRL